MQKNKKVSDYLTKTLVFQLVLCCLIFLAMLLFSKINPSAFNDIKSGYSEILEENITKEEAKESLKRFEDAVFAGVQSVLEANSGSETDIGTHLK